MRIVEFENGQFAIRKWRLFGWVYLDLGDKGFWWEQSSKWFHHCLTDDKGRLVALVRRHTMTAKPVEL